MERREAAGDLRHDGLSCPLGAAAELAGNRGGLSDQLRIGLSLGGVVRGVGLGPLPTRRRRIAGRGRDSLGTWNEGRKLLYCHLPDRRGLPAVAVDWKAALRLRSGFCWWKSLKSIWRTRKSVMRLKRRNRPYW